MQHSDPSTHSPAVATLVLRLPLRPSRIARQSQGSRVKGSVQFVTFASRPATKEQTAFRRQPATSFPARSRDSSTSFPLADHQSRQDKRTRDALFTRAPQHNRTSGFSSAPLPCLPCICCVSCAQSMTFMLDTKALCNTSCDSVRQ